MKYEIGDMIRLKEAYRGYHVATVVGFEGRGILAEFSSGMVMMFFEDELEG